MQHNSFLKDLLELERDFCIVLFVALCVHKEK